MQRLDDSILASGDAPLMSFIRVAGTAPYQLVLTEHGIVGIVTRSDLLRLPVRLLAFAFVTHLETLMGQVIRTRYQQGDDGWLERLNDSRRQKVLEKKEKYKEQRMDLDLLEYTDFCDKRDVVRRVRGEANDFVKDLEKIEKLRNSLAHAGEFVRDDAGARAFAELIASAEKWIGRLEEYVASRTRE
jgi:hypothetical protein